MPVLFESGWKHSVAGAHETSGTMGRISINRGIPENERDLLGALGSLHLASGRLLWAVALFPKARKHTKKPKRVTSELHHLI